MTNKEFDAFMAKARAGELVASEEQKRSTEPTDLQKNAAMRVVTNLGKMGSDPRELESQLGQKGSRERKAFMGDEYGANGTMWVLRNLLEPLKKLSQAQAVQDSAARAGFYGDKNGPNASSYPEASTSRVGTIQPSEGKGMPYDRYRPITPEQSTEFQRQAALKAYALLLSMGKYGMMENYPRAHSMFMGDAYPGGNAEAAQTLAQARALALATRGYMGYGQ